MVKMLDLPDACTMVSTLRCTWNHPGIEKGYSMLRFRNKAWAVLAAALILGALITVHPARANVTDIALFRRTCGTVNAFISYDGFSEGRPAFFAVFAVDLNGDCVFGEAGEPMKYVTVVPGGSTQFVGTTLVFPPVPEGSTIAVTAYEVDSAGVPVSRQIEPVRYTCTHRPARDKLPASSGIVLPPVAVVAKINVRAVVVYTEPTVFSAVVGGLGRGAMVTVIASNQRGDWVEVQTGGQTGWIMWETQAILFGPYADLPRLANAESFTPTPLPVTATLGP